MLKSNIYYDPIEYLREIIDEYSSIFSTDIFSHREHEIAFNWISANLSHFIPNLPFNLHEQFSKNVKWHQSWAQIDQNYLHLVDTTNIKDHQNILKKASSKSPYIFCTFHLGSYRLINFILASNKIPFNLITDDNYIKSQGEYSKLLFDNALNKFYNKSLEEVTPIDILNAENPNIAFEASRKLKEGCSLLFYIDGNTGVGGVLHNKEKNVKINFLNHEIYARKGIAFISYLTNTPIVPVINLRTGWLDRETHILPPIHPNKDISRNEYIDSTTKSLYKIFETYLKKYPEQWEGWFYIHKFMSSKPKGKNNKQGFHEYMIDVDKDYIFNFEYFGLMDYNIKKCLLHKSTFETSIIDDTLFKTLSLFKSGITYNQLKQINNLPFEQFEELIKLNLIILKK